MTDAVIRFLEGILEKICDQGISCVWVPTEEIRDGSCDRPDFPIVLQTVM